MTDQIRRSPLVSVVLCGAASLVAACASTPTPKMVDPCADQPTGPGGTADLGLGNDFAPVINGQNASVVPGSQGLRMFVVNARVRDLDVGPGDQVGGVNASASDQKGNRLSMDYGCRTRGFMTGADGWLYATSAYNLPLNLDALAQIDGAMVTLQVEVRDDMGHVATDTRTVVAHLTAANDD